MKNFFLFLALMVTGAMAKAQLVATPVCPTFNVDVMAGTVNELEPKSAIVEITTKFPCFSGIIEKDSMNICAGVFYPEKNINFFTGRRYIEIGEKFKGKLTPAIMGAARGSLFNTFGHPKLKDPAWEAYQMGYGTLIVYYNAAGKINKLQICNRSTDAIKLCQ